MRSQHRAPLVAYAIVAIVGLVVIMQTVSPDVMALQRVPRSLVGHGAYRVDDPPAPIAPQPLVPSGSSTSPTAATGDTRGGEGHAEPAVGTTPPAAMQHQPPKGHGSHGGVPDLPSGSTPPVQTPAPAPPSAPTYLLPPIGPLPGLPAPPVVSDMVDSLLPDAATPASTGGTKQGRGGTAASGGGTKVATKGGDQAGGQAGSGADQAGKQAGDAQDEQAPVKKPVRTLAALAAPAKKVAGLTGSDDGCATTDKDAGQKPDAEAPVPTLGNVLEGAGISPGPSDDPSASVSPGTADATGESTACDDGCSPATDAQPQQAAQDDAGTGTCASDEAQQDHSGANAHHARK